MAKSRFQLLRVLIPLFLFLFGCFTPSPPPGPIPEQSSVAILGETYRLAPGSDASFLVQVRNPYAGTPLPDRKVEVFLNTAAGGEGQRVFAGEHGRRRHGPRQLCGAQRSGAGGTGARNPCRNR